MLKVIIPAFNEGPYIYDNVLKVREVLDAAGIEHGFLLVDDGSRDNTWAELERLNKDHPNVECLRFSRNFGKEAAVAAAMDTVDADCVVVMDSDLQHPPRYIPEMYRLWQEGYEVVDGVKESRGKESIASKIFALTFYKFFAKATGIDIGVASDFKLLDRKVVEAWREMPEKNTFFRGLTAWVGFNRTQLPFRVDPRAGGESKWGFRSLMKLAIGSITSYTTAPLTAVFWLGMLMLLGAGVMTVQTLIKYFSGHSEVGFPTVILLLLFIGGGIMLALSIIGLYIAKIYEEVKDRPRYVVSKKI